MNTNTTVSLPFDDRNQQDFMLVTKRIQDALELMTNDRRLKRTETNLARLAGCSRGTLRNRQWPLKQLQKLKDDARTAKEQVEVEPRATRQKAQVERYREQLVKNRDELLFWKYKHDSLRDQMETLASQRDAYKRRAEEFETQLRSIATSNSRKSIGKIFPFSPTASALDGEIEK